MAGAAAHRWEALQAPAKREPKTTTSSSGGGSGDSGRLLLSACERRWLVQAVQAVHLLCVVDF